MALRGCLLLSKQCAFLFNFIIWISGIFLLCISIYIRMDATINHMVVVAYPDFTTHFHFVCYFLISLATIITLVGFFGCCSSFQESHSMLSMFIGCLVLFLMAQMATAAWLFMHRNSLKHTAGENIRRYIGGKYASNPFINEPLDHLQITFKCCGSEGPSDFLDSPFSNYTKKQHNIKNKNNNNNDKINKNENLKHQKQQPHQHQLQQHQQLDYHVPTSCCGYHDISNKQTINCINYKYKNNNDNNNKKDTNTNNDTTKDYEAQKNLISYEKGCRDELVASLKWLLEGVVVVALVFVVIQLLSLTLSICLCCGLKRHSAGGYK